MSAEPISALRENVVPFPLSHRGKHCCGSGSGRILVVYRGLEKSQVFLKKSSLVGFFLDFCFFVFLYICIEEIVYRVFQFQEYF
jgi:hypothetical protein